MIGVSTIRLFQVIEIDSCLSFFPFLARICIKRIDIEKKKSNLPYSFNAWTFVRARESKGKSAVTIT